MYAAVRSTGIGGPVEQDYERRERERDSHAAQAIRASVPAKLLTQAKGNGQQARSHPPINSTPMTMMVSARVQGTISPYPTCGMEGRHYQDGPGCTACRAAGPRSLTRSDP